MTKAKVFEETVKAYIESEKLYLPIFDPVAIRVQLELIKKDPDVRKIEKIIIGDQSLTSNILKVANSARFGGVVKTTTVRSAIVRLGTTEIGSIILLEMNRKHYRSHAPKIRVVMKKLWQHSVGCAFAAGWLSNRLDFGVMQNEAFFAGLFHDVGKLLILAVIERKVEQEQKKEKSMKVNNTLLFGAMNLLHAEQGAKLMEQLGLPEAPCLIAREHHLSTLDRDNYLLVLVRMANLVCHKMGIGIKIEKDLDLLGTEEADVLNLTAEDIEELQLFLESTPSLAE